MLRLISTFTITDAHALQQIEMPFAPYDRAMLDACALWDSWASCPVSVVSEFAMWQKGEWLTNTLLFLEYWQVARIARRNYAYAGNIYQTIVEISEQFLPHCIECGAV